MDMIHSIVIINLLGKSLEKFASERELLEGRRDAIKSMVPDIGYEVKLISW